MPKRIDKQQFVVNVLIQESRDLVIPACTEQDATLAVKHMPVAQIRDKGKLVMEKVRDIQVLI